MSEKVRTIGEVLTAASEVSSLGSNDRLLAFGSDGSLKKISQENANHGCSSAMLTFNAGASGEKWLRLGQFNANGVVSVTIMNSFDNNQPSYISFYLCCSDFSITVPAARIYPIFVIGSMFQKIRLVTDPSSRGIVYFDIHMANGANGVLCSLDGALGFVPNLSREEATVPSGWTVKEASIPGGG